MPPYWLHPNCQILLAASMPSCSQVVEVLFHHLAVVERHDRVRKFLICLMTLARDEHRVAGPRDVEGALDRFAPVVDDLVPALCAGEKPFLDLREDRFR